MSTVIKDGEVVSLLDAGPAERYANSLDKLYIPLTSFERKLKSLSPPKGIKMKNLNKLKTLLNQMDFAMDAAEIDASDAVEKERKK